MKPAPRVLPRRVRERAAEGELDARVVEEGVVVGTAYRQMLPAVRPDGEQLRRQLELPGAPREPAVQLAALDAVAARQRGYSRERDVAAHAAARPRVPGLEPPHLPAVG